MEFRWHTITYKTHYKHITAGDTIYPDGTTIQDVNGNPCTSPVVFGGSFDPSGIDMNITMYKMYLKVSVVNRGGISIWYYVRGESSYTITIYGINGRVVRRIKVKRRGFHRVNIKNMPGGIYFVRLWHGTEEIDKKVVITR